MEHGFNTQLSISDHRVTRASRLLTWGPLTVFVAACLGAGLLKHPHPLNRPHQDGSPAVASVRVNAGADGAVVESLRQACAGGDPLGCNNLGVSYRDGVLVDADPVMAQALFAMACDANEPNGCNNLGMMFEVGQAGSADRSLARELYCRACEAGGELGCSNLEALSATQSPDRTRELSETARSRNLGMGCSNVRAVASNSDSKKQAARRGR